MTSFVSSVASALTRFKSSNCVNTVNIIVNNNLFNSAALVSRDHGARSNFVTCCIPLSCKYRSDGGRNTPYGVPVVEASISSKSSGPLNDMIETCGWLNRSS